MAKAIFERELRYVLLINPNVTNCGKREESKYKHFSNIKYKYSKLIFNFQFPTVGGFLFREDLTVCFGHNKKEIVATQKSCVSLKNRHSWGQSLVVAPPGRTVNNPSGEAVSFGLPTPFNSLFWTQ